MGGSVAKSLTAEDLRDKATRSQDGGQVRVRKAEVISRKDQDTLSLLLLTQEKRKYRPGPGGSAYYAGQWGLDMQRVDGSWLVTGFSLESRGPC